MPPLGGVCGRRPLRSRVPELLDARGSRFRGAQGRLAQLVGRLGGLTGTQLTEETEDAIYHSALVNSWRSNHRHTHFKCTTCHREYERRDNAKHAEGCPARPNRYQRAHNRVMRDAWHPSMARPLNRCTCSLYSLTERG